MRKISSLLLLIVVLHLNGFAFAAINKIWLNRSAGISEGKVNCLYVGKPSEHFILAGTDKALYRSENHKPFQPVLQLYGNFQAINQIQIDSDGSSLYCATEAGVFVSRDQGASWENIFAPASALARKTYCVLADRGTIYAGTADGLYVKKAGETQWKKDSRELGKKSIFHMADHGDYIFAATEKDIFRIEKNDGQLKRMYSAADQHDEELDFDEEGEPIRKSLIKDLVSAGQGKDLFAVIGHDVLVSEDLGENWDNWLTVNLPVEFIRKLSVSNDENIYAATEKGIFYYHDGRWEKDVEGLSTNFVNDVAIDEDGQVHLATLNGVFTKGEADEGLAHLRYSDVAGHFKDEPTVKDVQGMAIRYANVNPKQIDRWHQQARAKAFLPSLSVGLNRADGELFHWDTTPNPDVLTRGRDYVDWSTSLSWDLSDLVWSSDQTSIDSRAKMMTELRQDILDQVTRLYFERRRMQIELVSASEPDLENEIRIEELTAMIDSLTGGEFTRRVNKDSPVSLNINTCNRHDERKK